MKTLIFMLCLISGIASADEMVQMNNGMTCWRNDVGVMYGCSGGVNNGDTGFNDVKTGSRYESINDGSRAVNTRNGSTMDIDDNHSRLKLRY
jgi:hypothetical protein